LRGRESLFVRGEDGHEGLSWRGLRPPPNLRDTARQQYHSGESEGGGNRAHGATVAALGIPGRKFSTGRRDDHIRAARITSRHRQRAHSFGPNGWNGPSEGNHLRRIDIGGTGTARDR